MARSARGDDISGRYTGREQGVHGQWPKFSCLLRGVSYVFDLQGECRVENKDVDVAPPFRLFSSRQFSDEHSDSSLRHASSTTHPMRLC